MAMFSRGILAALMAAAALLATTAEAQMIRMDGISRLLGPRANEPFGLATDLAPAGPLWIKWRTFETEFTKNEEEIAHCRAEPTSCSNAALSLIALIDEARALDGRRQLATVNRSVNLAVAYTSDMVMHGVGDVWSSPLSTFERGRGDCEDYAIAKMFVLRGAGMPADDLRLLIAHNRSDGDAHAVLAARLDGRWHILDNRKMLLLEDNAVRDLQPLYALDAGGVRQFVAPSAPVLMASATQAVPAPAAATHAVSNAMSGGDTLPLLM